MGSCLTVESRSPLGVSRKFPKRGGSRGSSYDSRRDDTPGRLSACGATEFASLFTQQGKKGTNQDAMVVWENFGSKEDTIFCGVFDGHGPNGHMVARRVRDHLPQKLCAQWEVIAKSEEVLREISLNTSSKNSDNGTFALADSQLKPSVIQDSEKHPDVFQILKESFLKAFRLMDRELRVHRTIDCFCSGTTAVTIVKKGKDLVIGNVGDSRAVLGTRDEGNALIPVQLTVDLKPNLPAEQERIIRCKGRVFALQDEPEVARVWLPKTDSPGLAMARAFGDFCLKEYGLIAVPDVSYRRLTEKDEFIVLASDGIWDVLSNKDVVEIVNSAPNQSSAAKHLVESAVRAWKVKYPTSKIDDCAVVCLFLDWGRNSVSSSTYYDAKEDIASQSRKDNSSNGGHQTGAQMVKDTTTVESSSDDELVKDDEDGGGPVDWSALEGVSRVNTLVTLPRLLVPGSDDKKRNSEESEPFI